MRSKQSYSGDKTSVLILGKLYEAMFSIEIIIIILFPMKIIIFAAILCPEPPAIKNMNVKHVNTTDNVYHFGNIVTYECIDGYRMFGNNVLRCLANGRWTRMQGKCTSMCWGMCITCPYMELTRGVLESNSCFWNSPSLKKEYSFF